MNKGIRLKIGEPTNCKKEVLLVLYNLAWIILVLHFKGYCKASFETRLLAYPDGELGSRPQ